MRFVAPALLLPLAVAAQEPADIVEKQVAEFIRPGFAAFNAAADALAAMPCNDMGTAYHDAFDAWMRMSHLRFGPTEDGDRGFALAFWPDERGATPRTLAGLIAAEDPVVDDPTAFAEISVAGRGFLALDWLLFDPERTPPAIGSYECRLAQAIAEDIDRIAEELDLAWRAETSLMRGAGAEGNFDYLVPEEAVRALYGALITGLEVTIDQRLARPLGTFERPRPRRAEAWRSERSARNVALSVAALSDYTDPFLTAVESEVAEELRDEFDRLKDRLEALDDPAFAGVSTPQGRLRIEAIQSALREIRGTLATQVAPRLGVSQSFNALDGD
ncbi:imelysin family protein [Pontivivens ytuae]|uniref:Imelysin family protein n=1 Tax=Pontivivens ytuae TaxID=2789856 RepID=A0A7S9LV29_9RHOB|nr:imelysin family protein [Pontivivens ytuae]QPH55654.1 imelysin family protein [Pontivivens ytuae]